VKQVKEAKKAEEAEKQNKSPLMMVDTGATEHRGIN